MDYLLGIFWGTVVGFAIAVPIGPVGLICIQRTLAKDRISGLAAGLGAALADALLASISAFGASFFFGFITRNHFFLGLVSGSFLIFIGIMAYLAKKKVAEAPADTALGRVEGLLSAFVVTVTNPLSIFVLFVAFANFSIKIGHSMPVSVLFVIGIFVGSCLWWMLLTYITDRIAHRFSQERIALVNRIFALCIAFAGVFVITSAFFKHF